MSRNIILSTSFPHVSFGDTVGTLPKMSRIIWMAPSNPTTNKIYLPSTNDHI